MPELTAVGRLAALDNRAFNEEVKSRMRNNDAWVLLLHPAIIERTRATLKRLIRSLNEQRDRGMAEHTNDTSWLRSMESLKRIARERLDQMPPQPFPDLPALSNTRETRSWRALAAALADELIASGSPAADELYTPYGALTVREWAERRHAKGK
jgi:hypothetical protein